MESKQGTVLLPAKGRQNKEKAQIGTIGKKEKFYDLMTRGKRGTCETTQTIRNRKENGTMYQNFLMNEIPTLTKVAGK